jgi:hypothetical protein
LTFGLRTRLGAGGGDSGEPGGESGADVWCRPFRLLGELDELVGAEGPGLEVALKVGNPPLLLVLPGAVGVWRAMSGVGELDETVGEACVLVGANSDERPGAVVPMEWPGASDGGGLLPTLVPVSMGGGRLSNGGFAPDNDAEVCVEDGGLWVPGEVTCGLLGVCGEGA